MQTKNFDFFFNPCPAKDEYTRFITDTTLENCNFFNFKKVVLKMSSQCQVVSSTNLDIQATDKNPDFCGISSFVSW